MSQEAASRLVALFSDTEGVWARIHLLHLPDTSGQSDTRPTVASSAGAKLPTKGGQHISEGFAAIALGIAYLLDSLKI